MPVNIGKENEGGTFEGLTGNFTAKPTEVADKKIEGREGRPDSLRVVFEVEGQDDKLSLFVPLHESAVDRLRPFIHDADNVPTDEAGLRSYLASNLPGDTFLVYASNGSIRGTTAPAGKHRIRLTGLHKFTRRTDGQERVRFFAETKTFETVTFTVKYPDLVCKVGQKPEQDDIGPAKELSPNKYLFEYLIAFGLDWQQFGQEITDAYQNGNLFTRLGLDGPEPGYFSEPDDITEELFQATKRHGPNRWCEVEIVDNKQYGLGPRRGEWSHIELTPIIVEGASDNAEFNREKLVFLEMWENLTKIVLGKDAARFMVGSALTDDGRTIAKGILVPLLYRWPEGMLTKKSDGTPAIHLPPTPETWNINAVACANLTAEKLMALDEEARFRVANLTDQGASIIAWAEENLADWWGGSGHTEEQGEVF